MGGFRKAMPFTFVTFPIGALALAGLPAHVGLLLEGRDPRPSRQPRRLLPGARRRRLPGRRLLTAFYSFRLVFRVFYGEPCRRRASSSAGELAHARADEPADAASTRTPTSASPGPEHHIAERELADAGGDGRRSPCSRSSAACVADPGRHRRDRATSSSPPSPTRSYINDAAQRRRASGSAWSSAPVIALAGIATAYRDVRAAARRHARAAASASRACTASS